MLKSVMSPFSDILFGGDRRSIERVADVVAAAMEQPRLVSAEIAEALLITMPWWAMRAADALEKLPRHIPNPCRAAQRSWVCTPRFAKLLEDYYSDSTQSCASPLCKVSRICHNRIQHFGSKLFSA